MKANFIIVVCLLTFISLVNSSDNENVTNITTTDAESVEPTTSRPTIKVVTEDNAINSVGVFSSTNRPENVGPPSRPYYRNVMRVSSVRRTGRTFNGGENTLESPLRPTASAQEYPRGTGVGSFAEVGMAITKSADSDNRNGRSYLGATEASVSSASFLTTSICHVTLSLILLATLTTSVI